MRFSHIYISNTLYHTTLRLLIVLFLYNQIRGYQVLARFGAPAKMLAVNRQFHDGMRAAYGRR